MEGKMDREIDELKPPSTFFDFNLFLILFNFFFLSFFLCGLGQAGYMNVCITYSLNPFYYLLLSPPPFYSVSLIFDVTLLFTYASRCSNGR